MTGRELELDQLINLFIHAKDRVSLYWGFYITLLTTIAGWLTTGGSSNQNLEVWLKGVIVLVFAAFVVLNCDALWRSYRFLNIIGGELSKVIEHHLSQKLKFALQLPLTKFLLFGHIIVDFVIGIAIWKKL